MRFQIIIKFFLLTLIIFFINSCGVKEKAKNIFKPVDLTKEPLDPDEKAKKNISEGRGISLGNLGNRSTNYEFSTSNPLWRASLDTLDFLPLTTVDYSGGLIITDWYNNDTNSNEELKITVRFLSNEIQSNSIKVQVHQKVCLKSNTCNISLLKSKISEELTKTILSKAARFDKDKKQTK